MQRLFDLAAHTSALVFPSHRFSLSRGLFFQVSQFIVILENKVFINNLPPLVDQSLLALPQLPYTDRRVRCITIRDRKVLAYFRVVKIDHTNVSGIALEDEVFFLISIFRVNGIDMLA